MEKKKIEEKEKEKNFKIFKKKQNYEYGSLKNLMKLMPDSKY